VDKLTAKQAMFVKEYLVDLNASQAAIRAGYSEKSSFEIGSENLRKPLIAEAIHRAMKKRSERTEITADRVLNELAAIGFANATQAVYVEGGKVRVKDTSDLDLDTRKAISEIKETTSTNGGSLGIKFHDKKGALELIGRHLGMWSDNMGSGDEPMPTKVEISVVDARTK
jgi:phage terminase small subunit